MAVTHSSTSLAAGAQVAIGHNTAREGEVIDRAAASLEPGKQATLVSAVISN